MQGKRYLLLLLILVSPLNLQAHSANEKSKIRIVQPVMGATVSNPVTLQVETEGIKLAAAGEDIHRSGHVLLLINSKLPDLDNPVPMDARHLHLVKGQDSTTIDLPVGKNRLQVMLLDEEHELFEEWLISRPVTVDVRAP